MGQSLFLYIAPQLPQVRFDHSCYCFLAALSLFKSLVDETWFSDLCSERRSVFVTWFCKVHDSASLQRPGNQCILKYKTQCFQCIYCLHRNDIWIVHIGIKLGPIYCIFAFSFICVLTFICVLWFIDKFGIFRLKCHTHTHNETLKHNHERVIGMKEFLSFIWPIQLHFALSF